MKHFLAGLAHQSDWRPVRSRATVLKKSKIQVKKTHFDRQAFLLNLKAPTSSYTKLLK